MLTDKTGTVSYTKCVTYTLNRKRKNNNLVTWAAASSLEHVPWIHGHESCYPFHWLFVFNFLKGVPFFFNGSVSSVLACGSQCCGGFRWTAEGQPCICSCAPAPPDSPPILAATSRRAEFPVLYSAALLAIRFKYSSVRYCEPLTESFSLCWVQANSVKKKSKQCQG